MNRKQLILSGLVAGLFVGAVVIGAWSTRGRQTPTGQVPPVAQQTVVAAPCTPPESARCKKLAAGQQAGTGFDFGEAPNIRLPGSAGGDQQSSLQKAGDTIGRIPILGGILSGIWTIIRGIDWILRNIWLVIVLLLIVAMLFRVPIWAPLFLLWEGLQTLWTKKTVREVWGSWHQRQEEPEKTKSPGPPKPRRD